MSTQPTLFADSTRTATVRIGGADVSPCGRYRYRLWREWNPAAARVCFVMLNPSTADATDDDPTIRKCITLATRWSYGSIDVVNLFAHRATDPRELTLTAFADGMVGPDNDVAIARAQDLAGIVVAAWGAFAYKHPSLAPRARRVERTLRALGHLHALRLTNDGYPWHPLYLPNATQPMEWR